MSILYFPRRRGRPKSAPKNDTGTPELIMKRLHQETAEAIDLCLEKGLITNEQHWCGIHLRWLYTLRYGAPSVHAIDPTHLGGIEILPDNLEWRMAREKEYHEAIRKLTDQNHRIAVMNLCIYNERPRFLNTSKKMVYRSDSLRILEDIQAGLETLFRHWKIT